MELLKTNIQEMSSKDIATITGKQHSNVMRDIQVLIEQLGEEKGELKFELSTFTVVGNEKVYPMYLLTKKEALLLASGYNAVLRLKIIDRWEELENSKPQIDFSNPDTILQLAQNWKEEREKVLFLERKNELQEQQLKISAPKVAYVDEVLQSKSTYPITLVAKELGMSAIALNKKLFDLHVQHKQSGIWVLYSKYQDKEYTKTVTSNFTDSQGNTRTQMLTVWTEKGRLFIHDLLKNKLSV